MRRWTTAAACAAVGVLTITGVTQATSPPRRIDKPSILKFLDVADKFEFVDVGRPAQDANDASPGDLFIFENNLRNPANTRTDGRFLSSCVALATPGVVSCRGTLKLADGTVELATTVNLAAGGAIVSAITGGTKRYANARGQVRLSEEISDGVRRMSVALLP